MFSNNEDHGGNLYDVLKSKFETSKNVSIASGYVSHDVLEMFKPDILKVAREGGVSRLLVGMAFYEGMNKTKLDFLELMHSELNKYNSESGVFVIYTRKFHGKIYLFNDTHTSIAYVGSSNFSRSGLMGNLECTTLIKDPETTGEVESYIDFLFDKENSLPITKAEITIPGSNEYKEKLKLRTLDDLDRYDPETIDKKFLVSFDFPLKRVVDKEKSSLNVYFGKGRWSRSSGKVKPRPWYEVELIANKEITSNPLYPKGDFEAYTDDGFIIPMKTQGDYFKNIRSKKSLQIFGQWIKGKLQRSGALIPLTPVTEDTLDAYGNDKIRFYKISEGKYFMEF